MNNSQAYHLVYVPEDACSGVKEHVISLFKTNSPEDVLVRTERTPGSIAMQLDATCEDELLTELTELGFTH